jgi:hypothetical protein
MINTEQRHPPERPWLSIWTRPRQTVRALLDYDPEYWVKRLAVLSGAVSGLSSGVDLERGIIWINILVLTVLGAVFGIVALYISAAIAVWAGRFLGGKGTTYHMRTALAWSSLTGVPATPLSLMIFLVPPIGAGVDALIAVFLLALTIAIGLWSFSIIVRAVAEVHRFSAWRSLASLLLPAVIFFVVGLICVGPLLLTGR